jgi:hypothetical protein
MTNSNYDIIGSSLKENIGEVKRFNNNDCWNIALALALNVSYETVRRYMSRKNYINSTGWVYGFRLYNCLVVRGKYHELSNHGYKTPRALAYDTEFTDYEYVVSTRGHIVYIRKGVIYDSYKSDLQRIIKVYRRKISKRRKPIHKFLK